MFNYDLFRPRAIIGQQKYDLLPIIVFVFVYYCYGTLVLKKK